MTDRLSLDEIPSRERTFMRVLHRVVANTTGISFEDVRADLQRVACDIVFPRADVTEVIFYSLDNAVLDHAARYPDALGQLVQRVEAELIAQRDGATDDLHIVEAGQ